VDESDEVGGGIKNSDVLKYAKGVLAQSLDACFNEPEM
jgi:hypothetical protein